MASTGQFAVVDNSVNERRLRPIYDCLDNGNNRKALQEAEKVLKKQPSSPCAKVLKALCLLRLGKTEECVDILETVHKQVPVDDPTLHAMTICYRELHKPECICNIYEAAIKKDPKNEEFLSHLFMSYVRISDYKKQQQTALALYKLKPKNPYYFWAVMSIVMQARECKQGKLAQMVTLPLAEKMIRKFVDEDKIESEAEVFLFIIILEMQNKWEDIVKVLSGPLVLKLVSCPSYVSEKKGMAYLKLEWWQDAKDLYKQLIIENPDNWQHIMKYLDIVFILYEKDNLEVKSLEKEANFLMSLKNLVESLSGSKKRIRGPQLSVLELCSRLHQCDINYQEVINSNPTDLLVRYFEDWSDVQCCFDDMKRYLHLVPSDGVNKFLDRLKECTSLVNGEYPQKVSEIHRHLTLLGLYKWFNTENTQDRRIQLFQKLVHTYSKTVNIGEGLPTTEVRCNDNYMILAVHVLLDACKEEKDDYLLVLSCVLLEQALRLSPASHQIKMLLTRLYSMLGAAGRHAGCLAWEALELKHMQEDSLGWMNHGSLIAQGHYAAAIYHYRIALLFFTTYYKDSADYMISSYKYGSFQKIAEFLRLKQRLENSLHFACLTVEKMILEVLTAQGTHAEALQVINCLEVEVDLRKDAIPFDDLEDNRDLECMATWNCPRKWSVDEMRRLSWDDSVKQLRVRDLMFRLVVASVALKAKPSNHVMNGDEVPPLFCLIEQMDALLNVISKYETMAEPDYPVYGPYSSRLYCAMLHHSTRILLLFARLVGDVWNNCTSSSYSASLLKDLEAAKLLAFNVMEQATLTAPTKVRSVLEHVVLLTECLGLGAVFCGCIYSMLKPTKTALSKKTRRKKHNNMGVTTLPDIFSEMEDVVRFSNRVCQELFEQFEKWQAGLKQDDHSWRMQSLSLDLTTDPALLQEVWSKLKNSYYSSTQEILNVLNSKIKYYSSLKL